MFEKRGKKFGNIGLSAIVAVSALTGCSSMPSAGEGKEEYVVGFPRHPAMMLFQAGNYEIEKIRSERGNDVFEIKGNHWAFGERGNCRIELPTGAEKIGYDVTQGIFSNKLWVGYELNEKRFVREYEIAMGGGEAKLKKEFPVVWDEKLGKYKKSLER